MKIFAINNYNYKPMFSGEKKPPILKGVKYIESEKHRQEREAYLLEAQKPVLPTILKGDQVVLSCEPYKVPSGKNPQGKKTSKPAEPDLTTEEKVVLERMRSYTPDGKAQQLAREKQEEADRLSEILGSIQADSPQNIADSLIDTKKGKSEE